MSVVHLNVGGQQFSTTLTTISHDPDSMLAKMVNDCWDLKKINSGQVSLPEESEKVLFIDRDPTFFGYILNYLRDGSKAVLPKKEEDLLRIKKEADFYQLLGLKHLASKMIRETCPQKLWVPKVGDIVQWQDNMIECFQSFFSGFTNGYYISPYDLIIKRKTGEIKHKGHTIIDTGSAYEIKVHEYECFVCKEPAYLKISRKSFRQDKWSISDDEEDDSDYQNYKSRFLMNTIQGEIEDAPNATCATVKWMASGPVFTTAYVNDRGNIQKCRTRTTKFHVPFTALKLKVTT